MTNRNFKEFDDNVLHDKRIYRCFKYHRKELNIKAWENGTNGDFEIMCRAVSALLGLYDAGSNADKALRKSVAFVSDFCLYLSPTCRRSEFFEVPAQLQYVDGVWDIPALIGWIAVAHVKDIGVFEIDRNMFPHNEGMRFFANTVYNVFDGYLKVRYNDIVVKKVDDALLKGSGNVEENS